MHVKRFLSSAGLEILVGQDDASNDDLSCRVAHPNDVWLHVAGAPGSHVLLRCGEAGGAADRESLREAAGLAAYFSKMRFGGKVPVHYCPARLVSKPPKARSGTVTIKRAQKLIVRPQLLPEASNPK